MKTPLKGSLRQQVFQSCNQEDGIGRLVIDVPDGLFSVESEWISSPLRMRLFDPLGKTIKILNMDKKSQTSLAWPGLRGSYDFRVDEEGLIEIDGNLIPLFADDFHCLLQQKWPQSWRHLDWSVDGASSNKLVLSAEGSKRDFQVSWSRNSAQGCSTIYSQGFLGVGGRGIRVCIDQKQAATQIILAKGYKINWYSQ